MRILYVGNAMGISGAERYYMAPLRMINGFIRNGHTVVVYNDRDHARMSNLWRSSRRGKSGANRGLLQTAEKFQPELIVLGHCELIGNRTLAQIRQLDSAVKIIYRNVDSLVQRNNADRIHHRADAVDGIFLTTGGEEIRQFERDRVFVSFFPNPIDPGIDTGRAFDNPAVDGDVFYAGEIIRDMVDSRRQAVDRIVAELADLRLHFHGSVVGKPSLVGTAYLAALNNCKIGLSLDRTDDYQFYASDRMSHYLGNGLLTFVHRGKGFEDIFTGSEMVFYDDIDDLIAKCRKYAAADDAWREIAAAGYRKAREIFDGAKVTQYMIEQTFGMPLSQDYVWHGK